MARRKPQTLGVGGAVVLMAATMSLHAPAGQAQRTGLGLPARVAALEASVANRRSQRSALQQETQFVSVAVTEMCIGGQSRQ
jgi:hypothetical protein